jgi:hypothetical protein
MKRTQSSLADKLNIRAVAALDRAREMPPGDARAEAMNKAMILRNAVEVHEHFFGKGGAGSNEGSSALLPSRSTVRAS